MFWGPRGCRRGSGEDPVSRNTADPNPHLPSHHRPGASDRLPATAIFKARRQSRQCVTLNRRRPLDKLVAPSALDSLVPYLDPYRSCFMRLMRLVLVVSERG